MPTAPLLVRFIFRKNARNPEGEGYLYCRVTVHGEECTPFACNLRLLRKEWDATAQRMRGRSSKADTVKAKLSKIEGQFESIRRVIEDVEKRRLTLSEVMERYQAADAPRLTLVDLADLFLKERETLVDVDIRDETHRIDRTRYRRLVSFLKTVGRADLLPEQFNDNLCDQFYHYLRVGQGLGKSYALKNTDWVGMLLRWAVKRNHLDRYPIKAFKVSKPGATELQFLELDELGRLTYYPFALPSVQRAADCFVFQCWTGLAYADMANLNIKSAVFLGQDGRRWLRVIRQKSTADKPLECLVPLLDGAERILAKHKDALPVISNQRYNRYLKEVAAIIGLSVERLTSHIGRKTAGVLLLNAGLRMEVVSRILGHRSVKLTEKIYTKILDSTIEADVERVFGRAGNHPLEPPIQRGRDGIMMVKAS